MPSHAPDSPGGEKRHGGILRLPQAHGPIDIIGDVHGCRRELLELLKKLGYAFEREDREIAARAPAGRMLAFTGDLLDRGPDSPGVLRLAMELKRAAQAIFIAGNRDLEVLHALEGRAVQMTRGLARTLEQMAAEPESFREEAIRFLRAMAWQAVLDNELLVITHAGLPEEMQGRATAEAHDFAIRGRTTGERDQFGMLVRLNWTAAYRGAALVVYGHTPVEEPLWVNNTVNLDTGCVYGGHLTALRYPERETVAVAARAVYSVSRRAFPANARLAGNP